VVGAALAHLHRRPCHAWTLDELASEAGTSRSVLAERFARFLGEPPLTYLARWRLQLAARKLQTTRGAILQVASDVGYESETAFNRAFKREFGLPPAQYRRKLAASDAGLPTRSNGDSLTPTVPPTVRQAVGVQRAPRQGI
jgi:AraC-like DNA-binding protein